MGSGLLGFLIRVGFGLLFLFRFGLLFVFFSGEGGANRAASLFDVDHTAELFLAITAVAKFGCPDD